jgi:hypothetical protein
MLISEMDGQGVKQFLELGSAFLLSAAIGLEREIRHKSAGLRTYTVVGTAAALFLLISKYGFMNVLAKDLVVLDPSRVAAQIVTGIGFIGAGLNLRAGGSGPGPHNRRHGLACDRHRHGLRRGPLAARACRHNLLFHRGVCLSPLAASPSRHADAHRTGQGFGA